MKLFIKECWREMLNLIINIQWLIFIYVD